MFEEKIFIPKESKQVFDSYNCHFIKSNGEIISFNNNITCSNGFCDISTFKIYQKNHYLYQYEDITLKEKDYQNMVSSCIYSNYDNFTSDVFYRFDIDSILVIFLILLIILFLFPYKIISRMFGRWFKW